MFKKVLIIGSVIVGSSLLVGCGEDERVSMQTAEEQRGIARDNSVIAAKKFVSENPTYTGYKVIPNGDSTITRDCPAGDGWASIKLFKDNKTVGIKCSTYSLNTGCLLSSEFSTKAYAQQEGTCNDELEYPLPKMMK